MALSLAGRGGQLPLGLSRRANRKHGTEDSCRQQQIHATTHAANSPDAHQQAALRTRAFAKALSKSRCWNGLARRGT